MGYKYIVFGAIDPNANPWDYLGTANQLDSNSIGWKAFVGLAQDWYTLCMALGIIGLLINLVIFGIKIMVSKNANKRASVKEALQGKLFIAIMLFGVLTVIGTIVTLVEALVS